MPCKAPLATSSATSASFALSKDFSVFTLSIPALLAIIFIAFTPAFPTLNRRRFDARMACRVGSGLEWIMANAAQRINKQFAGLAPRAVGAQQGFQNVRNFCRTERRAHHLAPNRRAGQCGAVGPPQGDLVPLFAVFIHAQDADMAAVVVAAAVDAAAHVQVNRANVQHLIHVLVTLQNM